MQKSIPKLSIMFEDKTKNYKLARTFGKLLAKSESKLRRESPMDPADGEPNWESNEGNLSLLPSSSREQPVQMTVKWRSISKREDPKNRKCNYEP